MFYLALVIRYHLIALHHFLVILQKCLVAWMKALLKTTKTHYTKEKQYVICNLGSGVCWLRVMVSAKLTIGKEKSGKFDE